MLFILYILDGEMYCVMMEWLGALEREARNEFRVLMGKSVGKQRR
jgi:hypothetical protein